MNEDSENTKEEQEKEELKKEEQVALDTLIGKMDLMINKLDMRLRQYVQEAKNADISVNPDQYITRILAQRGMKDTEENRKKILNARDELYHMRLLLEYERDGKRGFQELKIGKVPCMFGADMLITDWKMPVCRHYLLNNASTEYRGKVYGKVREVETDFRLLVKNEVKLRFSRVREAKNIYPVIYDPEMLERIKGAGFYSDEYINELIRRFNPDDYDPDSAYRILWDEFLEELLARRASTEFRDIVFSIQKKQGEIIQAPYEKHMIVQGCAGSGKSMIMLHRLPILLYDHPEMLRTGLYVISPSQMYVQLSESMRYQLEISDLRMGTIEQYYDVCIGKYPGHKAGEYGKILHYEKLSSEMEAYVYSDKMIDDINSGYEKVLQDSAVSLDSARAVLRLSTPAEKKMTTFAGRIQSRLVELQSIVKANNDVLVRYYKAIGNVYDSLRSLSAVLKNRKNEILRGIAQGISKQEMLIRKYQNEIDALDPVGNAQAIKNRKELLDATQQKKQEYEEDRKRVNEDSAFFDTLADTSMLIESITDPIRSVETEFHRNQVADIYSVINQRSRLIEDVTEIINEIDVLEDSYAYDPETVADSVVRVKNSIATLGTEKGQYLDLDYFQRIRNINASLSDFHANGIRTTYETIMLKLGARKNAKGTLRAMKCSPYIYLQTLFLYHGAPNAKKETLLSIDEAQGIAPEEIRLLKRINDDEVVFNLYGDINQHIEDSKGVDSWEDFKQVIDSDYYEMQENYRNALQITEYCNRVFGMNMVAINTPGKGVHELHSDEEFHSEMVNLLMDDQRAGLGAILVGNDAEARYLLGRFSQYSQRFHDMTADDFAVHRTRWNIILIDDAKGLEFSSVIVLAGRMSRNQRYIAYTRALDDLYVYQNVIDVSEYEKKSETDSDESEGRGTERRVTENRGTESRGTKKVSQKVEVETKKESRVRQFFEERGLKVIDNRETGGRLWVIGEQEEIRDIVKEAISKFSISGKYASGNEIDHKHGWYTKTDK